MKTATSTLACLMSMICAASTTIAAPVTFTFRGAVTDVPTELGSQFAVGQVISGSYTFESTSTSTTGTYVGIVSAFDVSIGGYNISQTSAGDIAVANGATDTYTVVSFTNGDAVGSAGLPFLHALQFSDPTGSAFTNTDLPLTPPDVSAFASPLFTVDYAGTGNPRLVGRIDTLAVPEPSSLAAIGLLAGSVIVRRRRHQPSGNESICV